MTESNRTNRRTTVLITFIAGGLFLLGAGLIPLLANAQQKALQSAAPIFPPAITNYPSPTIALTDLGGTATSIEDYRGQVILVNNWATWCPPCKIEMPELQAYYLAHSAEGFVVVAIESGEPADQVVGFVKELGLSFPVWLDPLGKALEIFQNWDLPSSYVIDRNGIVRFTWTGAINQPTLEQYVTPLLEENK
jgi:cytochrome c biogenesis protein CcmG/thiol:disulfide interchange protein DsbE